MRGGGRGRGGRGWRERGMGGGEREGRGGRVEGWEEGEHDKCGR